MCSKEIPSIAYVDEKEDERDNFFMDAYDSGFFSNVFVIDAYPTLEETMSKLLEHEFDAFVTDFNLAEEGGVPYTGEDLVAAMLTVKEGFPCFVRTSHEPDALAVSEDVNRVYSKDTAAEEHSDKPIFLRIDLQIKKYHKRLDGWRKEIDALLLVDASDRDAKVVSRILELDHKLEAAIGADVGLPMEVKSQVFGRRTELHDQTEKLIEDMKRQLGDFDA